MISEKIHETVNYIKNPSSTRLSVTILGSQSLLYVAIPEGVKHSFHRRMCISNVDAVT